MDMWNAAIAKREYDWAVEEHESVDACGRGSTGSDRRSWATSGTWSEGRLDETFVDALCEPAEVFTYGGMIAHVLTFAAYRRTLVVLALTGRRRRSRLGRPDAVFEDIAVEYDPGTTTEVTMHDGSRLRLRKLEEEYDPKNRIEAITRLNEAHEKGEVLTGVFYVNTEAPSFVDLLNMTDEPLATLPESMVRPGREVLEQVMEELR